MNQYHVIRTKHTTNSVKIIHTDIYLYIQSYTIKLTNLQYVQYFIVWGVLVTVAASHIWWSHWVTLHLAIKSPPWTEEDIVHKSTKKLSLDASLHIQDLNSKNVHWNISDRQGNNEYNTPPGDDSVKVYLRQWNKILCTRYYGCPSLNM